MISTLYNTVSDQITKTTKRVFLDYFLYSVDGYGKDTLFDKLWLVRLV